MITLERSTEHRWTIDKNVNSRDILTDFAALMANRRSFNLRDISNDAISFARGDSDANLITVGVRLLQAKYYMLGYDVNEAGTGQKKFMPSPMTVNYMSSDDETEHAKNFLVNLFCIQYPNPANRTPNSFQVYAGRLFVKLLLDSRIDSKLYIDECIWFLPFIEYIDRTSYEELIESIIEYRALSYEKKWDLFKSIENFEYLFANLTHEMNYYFLRLFRNMGVFDILPDASHNGGKLFRFEHVEGTFRNDAYDSRKNISGFVTLSDLVINAAQKLNSQFSAFETPTNESDPGIYNREYWLTNLYEIEPLAYLNCINTSVDPKSHVTAVVAEMVRASKFGSHDGTEFENALKPFMELFQETCDVQIISGAGNTDLLCTMEDLPSHELYKMNVDAKTRNSGLQEINASRLTRHILKHGAQFCIVVAPRFARGVKEDISFSKVVTITSEVLGSYCYWECAQAGKDFADFTSIQRIIQDNLGSDITPLVQNLTVSRYGLNAS